MAVRSRLLLAIAPGAGGVGGRYALLSRNQSPAR